MFDAYGTEQVYLVKPTKIDYSIPNYGQVLRIWTEEIFRTYHTTSAKGFSGGTRIQLNQEQAERFAVLNSLTIITEDRQYEILDRKDLQNECT